jgi:hypothetical protein
LECSHFSFLTVWGLRYSVYQCLYKIHPLSKMGKTNRTYSKLPFSFILVDEPFASHYYSVIIVFLNFCYVQACSLKKMSMWICLKPGPTPSTQAHWPSSIYIVFTLITSRLFFWMGELCFCWFCLVFMYLSPILLHETNIRRGEKTVYVVFENTVFLLKKGGGGGRYCLTPICHLSILLTYTVSHVLTYPYDWRGFVVGKKKTPPPLSPTLCTVYVRADP